MFKENQAKLLEGLKAFVTADNTESVTKLCEIVKGMGEEHEALKSENTKLKDKIVDIVSGTMFKDAPQNEIVEKEKSFDEIFDDVFSKFNK